MLGRAIVCTALSALGCCIAPAAGRAQAVRAELRVAVDWRGVADADIQRCGLSRLRAGTIESLIEDGHAVVDDSGQGGVRVAVNSDGARLRIEVSAGEVLRVQDVALPPDCDATLALEVIARISELVNEVAAAAAPEPVPVPEPVAEPVIEPEPEPETESEPDVEPGPDSGRAAFQGSLDAAVRATPGPYFLFGGGLGARARVGSSFELGGRVELTGNALGGVTVLEGLLAFTAAYQPALPGVGPFIEVGPLLHSATSDGRDVLELDAALGVGVQLSLGHLLAQLLVYGRLRSLEHRVGSETAYESNRFGLIVRIGAQLSGS